VSEDLQVIQSTVKTVETIVEEPEHLESSSTTLDVEQVEDATSAGDKPTQQQRQREFKGLKEVIEEEHEGEEWEIEHGEEGAQEQVLITVISVTYLLPYIYVTCLNYYPRWRRPHG